MLTCDIQQRSYQDTLSSCDGTADLVFTSPPYESARTYGAGVAWTFTDYQNLGDSIYQALKPGGTCILNLSGPVRETRPGVGTERSLNPYRVLLDWTDRVGFRCPDVLAYGRQGMPGGYVGRFRQDWEPLFWLEKSGGTETVL